jgi:hypothetical protein
MRDTSKSKYQRPGKKERGNERHIQVDSGAHIPEMPKYCKCTIDCLAIDNYTLKERKKDQLCSAGKKWRKGKAEYSERYKAWRQRSKRWPLTLLSR